MSLLEAHQVSKSFGGIRALDACSITVEEGTIAGLIGPNGSGKTTLFNVMTGYERVDTGDIRLRGTSITNSTPDRIFSRGTTPAEVASYLVNALIETPRSGRTAAA